METTGEKIIKIEENMRRYVDQKIEDLKTDIVAEVLTSLPNGDEVEY